MGKIIVDKNYYNLGGNMKKVNVYLSNLAVGNIKLHNLHWNLKGFAFKQVHEYLEMLYDEYFEYMDAVAELQKMQGEYPLASVEEFMKNTTVKELESKDYTVEESVKMVIDELEAMRKLALEIREEADEKDNFPLANMMEDHIAFYDKQIWFTKSMLG